MVEVEGKIVEQSVYVLIDLESTHSYITPRVVEICAFKKLKHSKSWLVQLANGTNRKVSEVVEKCVNVFVTSECIHLYISYCISLYPDGDVCSSDRKSH